MTEKLSINSIKLDSDFQLRGVKDCKEGKCSIENLIEKLKENPSFDVEPIICWKSPSNDIYLIDGHHRFKSYKESNRDTIPVIFTDCGGAKNSYQVKDWIFININKHLSRPLSTKDKKLAFYDFALSYGNLNKTYKEMSEMLDIPLGTIKTWGSQLGVKKRRQALIDTLSEQKNDVSKIPTNELLQEWLNRQDKEYSMLLDNEDVTKFLMSQTQPKLTTNTLVEFFTNNLMSRAKLNQKINN